MTDTDTETTEAGATPARRGRPRPQETLARDEQALAALRANGPATSAKLGELMGVEKSIAYLCLWRLRSQGLVERFRSEDSAHTWRIVEPTAT